MAECVGVFPHVLQLACQRERTGSAAWFAAASAGQPVPAGASRGSAPHAMASAASGAARLHARARWRLDAAQDSPRRPGLEWVHPNPELSTMAALKELFTSDVGLFSLAGLTFMIGMGVFFLRYFLRHMHEDEARMKGR
jgi:hypothetical protein